MDRHQPPHHLSSQRSLKAGRAAELVPFQGIGTRLRRTRSKDRSSCDNLVPPISLKQQSRTNHANGLDFGPGTVPSSGGTLERPKRFYSGLLAQQPQYMGPAVTGAEPLTAFVHPSSLLYHHQRNGSTQALYEESRLIQHQYEEPQYLLLGRNGGGGGRVPGGGTELLYGGTPKYGKRTTPPTSAGDPYAGAASSSSGSSSYKNGRSSATPTATTVIPPSKLFAKTLTTYSKQQQQQPTYETFGSSVNRLQEKQQDHHHHSHISGVLDRRHPGDNVDEEEPPQNDTQDQDLDLEVDLDDDDDHQETDGDDQPTLSAVDQHHQTLTSKLQMLSTATPVVHTYANPFQNHLDDGSSPTTAVADTTGPMIPSDLNTMRPSDLLKNSFAGSVRPPVPPNGGNVENSNLFVLLSQRMLTYLRAIGGSEKTPDVIIHNHTGGDGGSSSTDSDRCCRCGSGGVPKSRKLPRHWSRLATLGLLVLVFILIIIIIFLSAMNRANENQKPGSRRGGGLSDGGTFSSTASVSARIPCVVVEDLDPSSSHQHHHHRHHVAGDDGITQPDEQLFLPSYDCPATNLPRDPSVFKEILLSDTFVSSHHYQQQPVPPQPLPPVSFRLAPYGSWPGWFNLPEASRLDIRISVPFGARLALLAARHEPPTLARHQVFLPVFPDSTRQRRRNLDPVVEVEHRHRFDSGTWYLVLINDVAESLPVMVNISVAPDHGGANETDMTVSTSDMAAQHCPNDCHNRGVCHLGKCQCFPGSMGLDCGDNVCPVFCGGHGQYLEGSCRCHAGWKGRECTVPTSECEVSDCNGNGDCKPDGRCRCRPGYKGEHCDQVTCLDPLCSGHGVCLDAEAQCICRPGWTGTNCSEVDQKLHQFFPNCSNHGIYDYEHERCRCHAPYTGAECHQLACSLDCGPNGQCRERSRNDGATGCVCQDGWIGPQCQYRQCDQRCSEHGRCQNGTCHCHDGWMGRHCTLNGCPNSCNKHGKCSKVHSTESSPIEVIEWKCICDIGWHGVDCSAPQETNCNDEIDNDNDGLVDCADSECCHHKQCGNQSLMCITSPDPLDILLRKQPVPATASFFQKVSFLVDDGSVQSYAQKNVYSARRAAVIRGRVVSHELNGLIGIRVSVVNDLKFGFTLTRADGWFDILVNGGGAVTLQFQRNPFYPINKSVLVGWNQITVIPNPIVMYLVPHGGDPEQARHQSLLRFRQNPSLLPYNLFTTSDFGESHWQWWMSAGSSSRPNSKISGCLEHDYRQMRPVVIQPTEETFENLILNSVCDTEKGCIHAEDQIVEEKIRIGTTRLYATYKSSQASGFRSVLAVQLTPSTIPKTLRFVLVRIQIEGTVHEKIFEADPQLKFRFPWNRRNVYRQKVYGWARAKVYVGYYYDHCPQLLWTAIGVRLRGFDMEVTDLGQWNLDVQARYNPHDGTVQRGDGQWWSFRHQLPLIMEPVAGIDGHQRTYGCTDDECTVEVQSARFFHLVSLASAPDGSVFVGDANLIRRISPEGVISTVFRFKNQPSTATSTAVNNEYHLAFNSIDQYLYISDSERFQIVRILIPDSGVEAASPEPEVVIGTGQQCFATDRFQCDDGKLGPEVQLIYPKQLAFGLDGSLFFADGNLIRMMDTSGYVRRVVGRFGRIPWKPLPACRYAAYPAFEIPLKWPTSVTVNPEDGAMYFVDQHVLFKLDQNMMVSIVWGHSTFCQDHEDDQDSHRLLGAMTSTPSGSMYIVETDRTGQNRILRLRSDGSGQHVAGWSRRNDGRNDRCPVERCADISGLNCTCLIEDYDTASSSPTETETTVATNVRLQTVAAITATGDDTVYVADSGRLRLYALKPYLPSMDDQQEIKILDPSTSGNVFIFDKHGQHLRTRNIRTGRTLYSFTYDQNRLTEVNDQSGQKLSFVRDKQTITIESTSGVKCQIMVNGDGLLEKFTNGNTSGIDLRYYPNGLIQWRMDRTTGQVCHFEYDPDGRVRQYTPPTGAVVQLHQDQSKLSVGAKSTPLFDTEEEEEEELQFSVGPDIFVSRGGARLLELQQTGSVLKLNTSGGGKWELLSKVCRLSRDMVPAVQAQLLPQISSLITGFGQRGPEPITIDLDYRLRLKSTFIDSVEKYLVMNRTTEMLKIEYDWNANREIYYNQSQRPVLFVQHDEYGRPIQWIPNAKNDQNWLAYSITYGTKLGGQINTWQHGQRSQTYHRDRSGHLIEIREDSPDSTTSGGGHRSSSMVIRYSYQADIDQQHNLAMLLPSTITLNSGRRYQLDHEPNTGRIQSITSPKGSKHNLFVTVGLGVLRFDYCPPSESDPPPIGLHTTDMSHCHLIYYRNEDRVPQRPSIRVLPYDGGKIVYHYGSRYSQSKEFQKDFYRLNETLPETVGPIRVDRIIHGGNGLVERWHINGQIGLQCLRGIWRQGASETAIQYKYGNRGSGGTPTSAKLLKHQIYQFVNLPSTSQLSYAYRYDGQLRLRSIQPKLGSVTLASCDFTYDTRGRLESVAGFRYFERNANETLLGDGIALLVRRFDPTRRLVRHSSLTVSDREVFRVDYQYDNGGHGRLIQTRTFMHHLGANKIRIQNFTYDSDGQLTETQGREHWRFVYDPNGNLITFLYMGNRVDLEYDSGDRIRSFGKSSQTDTGDTSRSQPTGTTPYRHDGRGFVVQRGDERLVYNAMGQLLQAIAPNRYEVNYIYDYRGRLVIRRDDRKNVTQYFYGDPRKPDRVTHVVNNADGRVMSLIYDDNQHQDDLLIMLRLNNENFYVVCDQTGSPILVVDHRGQVIKETHRSPYGHVLFDSNPTFHVPVDFHGGLADPVTGLVYLRGRIYDTLIGRYLTAFPERLLETNLIKNPRAIHLYQFHGNDPINSGTENEILSLGQIERILKRETHQLINSDGLPIWWNFASSVDLMANHLKKIFTDDRLQSSSVSTVRSVMKQFGTFSTSFQPSSDVYYSKLAQNDWTDITGSWPLLASYSAFPPGIALIIDPDAMVWVTILMEKKTIALSDLTLIEALNGSQLFSFDPIIMAGQDYYFLVKSNPVSGDFYGRLTQSTLMINSTIQELENEHDKIKVIEIKIHHNPRVIFNLRVGTTLSQERERIRRLVKKHATEQKLAWEKLTNLNGHFQAEYYHHEQLAEDPWNIQLSAAQRTAK